MGAEEEEARRRRTRRRGGRGGGAGELRAPAAAGSGAMWGQTAVRGAEGQRWPNPAPGRMSRRRRLDPHINHR